MSALQPRAARLKYLSPRQPNGRRQRRSATFFISLRPRCRAADADARSIFTAFPRTQLPYLLLLHHFSTMPAPPACTPPKRPAAGSFFHHFLIISTPVVLLAPYITSVASPRRTPPRLAEPPRWMSRDFRMPPLMYNTHGTVSRRCRQIGRHKTGMP